MNLKTISAKLNLILLVTVLSVLIGYGVISYDQYSQKLSSELQADIKRVNKRLNLILPTVIWNLQSNLVQEIIETEALDEIIDVIIVKDVDNSIIASVINDRTIDLNNNRCERKLSIEYENEIIANVFIYHNHNKIEQAERYIIQSLVIKVVIIFILLQLLFSFFVNKFIISNIDKLQKGIASFSEKKNFDIDIDIDSKDELHLLAQEFNSMKNNLKDSWKQLNELNQHLEERVEEEVEKNEGIQKQLFKSEKMVAMGEMIGNIAHQWRQPLSVISTSSTGMIMQQEFGALDKESLVKYCNMINDNAQYLSKTIDDFRNFIKGDRKLEEFNLKETMDSFINLILPSIKKDEIELVLDIDSDIKMNGYPNELIQCFINIFNNSKDAFEDNNKLIKLVFISIVNQNDKIMIKFRDNANGIPKDVIHKIFEPYFTTKHQSKGTGLGLHMTYNLIVDGMNGKIEVDNVGYEYHDKSYIGAEFSITLYR